MKGMVEPRPDAKLTSKWVQKMKKIKNKLPVVLAIVIIAFLIYLFMPYFMVKNLTRKYEAEFLDLYSENGFYNNIEYLKVFQYRDEKADIYYLGNNRLKKELDDLGSDYAVILYVEENHSSAALFIFYDENGQWKLSSWNLIWSISGTADGIMWPYYF